MASGAQQASSRSSPAAVGACSSTWAKASDQVVVTRLSYPAGSPRASISARRPRYRAR